jgi:hypothetical protein
MRLRAVLTAESKLSDREVEGVLKQIPKTAPGPITKLKTALNKFKGVGSNIAWSKTDASRVSSRDQLLVIISFQVAGEEAGILRALTITLVRKGRSSSKEGTSLKIGAMSLSGAGEATKARTGSDGALGRQTDEGGTLGLTLLQGKDKGTEGREGLGVFLIRDIPGGGGID